MAGSLTNPGITSLAQWTPTNVILALQASGGVSVPLYTGGIADPFGPSVGNGQGWDELLAATQAYLLGGDPSAPTTYGQRLLNGYPQSVAFAMLYLSLPPGGNATIPPAADVAPAATATARAAYLAALQRISGPMFALYAAASGNADAQQSEAAAIASFSASLSGAYQAAQQVPPGTVVPIAPSTVISVTHPSGAQYTVSGTGAVLSSAPPGSADQTVQTLTSPAAPPPAGFDGTMDSAGSPAPIVQVSAQVIAQQDAMQGDSPSISSSPGSGGGTTTAPTTAVLVQAPAASVAASSAAPAGAGIPQWAAWAVVGILALLVLRK